MPTAKEKLNVLLLFGSQSLFQTASVMVTLIAGLIGQRLATDKSLATLPIAMMVVAAALTMIPASFFMQRFGRKAGFLLGAAAGACAGLTAAFALWIHSFWVFVAGNVLVGCYQGFAQYYRFAAADASSDDFRSRAIAWVIGGGVVAAVAGPNIARLTQGIGATPFLASYLCLVLLSAIASVLMLRLDLPDMHASGATEQGRPLAKIVRQPVFVTALTGSAIAYAAMMMVMTATPLAMQGCGLPLGSAATVIQWHVLGMYVPSFFTGHLIRRFGVLKIMFLGTALLASQVSVALSGTGQSHFLFSLVLLGIGWNFLYIGGTTLLTETYRPNERAKVQALNDFMIFAVTSIASLSAGGLLHFYGWRLLNTIALPLVGVEALMLAGLGIARQRQVVVPVRG